MWTLLKSYGKIVGNWAEKRAELAGRQGEAGSGVCFLNIKAGKPIIVETQTWKSA